MGVTSSPGGSGASVELTVAHSETDVCLVSLLLNFLMMDYSTCDKCSHMNV